MITATADLTTAIRKMLADYRAIEGGGWRDGVIILATRGDNDAEEIARMVDAGEMDEVTAGHYLAVTLATGDEIVAAWPHLDRDCVADLTQAWDDEDEQGEEDDEEDDEED